MTWVEKKLQLGLTGLRTKYKEEGRKRGKERRRETKKKGRKKDRERREEERREVKGKKSEKGKLRIFKIRDSNNLNLLQVPIIFLNTATKVVKLGFRVPPIKTFKAHKALKNQYVITLCIMCLLKMGDNNVQAYLGDIIYLLPELQKSKYHTAIKQVTYIFWFPSAYKSYLYYPIV